MLIWAELQGGPKDGEHIQIDDSIDAIFIFGRGQEIARVTVVGSWEEEIIFEILQGKYERDRAAQSDSLDPIFQWRGWE